MRDFVGDSGGVDGRNGISAADNRNSTGIFRNSAGNREGPFGER